VFNDLSMLSKGDKIIVYFKGNEREYMVDESKIVSKTAVEYLDHSDEEILTLMTCWPLGLDVKRYMVFAKPAES
jgi:LPXTG-site transpeptidase (sortase) family protein